MLSSSEILATAFGLLYIVFIILKKPIGWFFGFLSSILYVEICYSNQLFIQTGLQSLYALIGVFGFFRWKLNPAPITIISKNIRLVIIIVGLVASFILGYLFSKSIQVLPYLDATISVFGVIATYLTTEKRLENWIIWMLINLLSIYLFAYQELYLTVFLFCAYFILSIWGFLNWKRDFNAHE